MPATPIHHTLSDVANTLATVQNDAEMADIQATPTPSRSTMFSQPPSSQPSQVGPIRTQRQQGTCSTTHLTRKGHPYWKKSSQDWAKDATGGLLSSRELLLRWLELPNNVARFKAGYEQYSQDAAAKAASLYLWESFGPVERTPKATLAKVSHHVAAV